MIGRIVAVVCGTLLASLPRNAAAEPVTTAWLEDVHVEPEGATETVVSYTHQSVDLKASAEGYDQLGVGLHAGVAAEFTLAPEVAFRQRGEEPLRLHQVGLRARWLAFERSNWPALMVYGGYGNDLGEDRDHGLALGAAAHYELAWLFANADVRPSLNVGGNQGTTLETWYGFALGYGSQGSLAVRAGLEAFLVVPVVGERMSDPTFGSGVYVNTYYYGPSLALAVGPFWSSLSAVTGYPLSDAASQLMLRGLVGVAH
jgi:hypothetical protein